MDLYGQWNQQYAPMDPAAQAQAHQMYWQQYYGGYGPPQPFYGYGVPPAGMPPMIPPAAGVVGGPIPPIEPPKEEQPPLPMEPPPEEEKKTPFKQDDNKLSALQVQAAQWQQQKQWEDYQKNLVEYQQQLQQWNSQQATLLDQVTKEEVEFDSQYSDWVKQYNDWKEQNKNHPNKDQYQQYEQQWKQYEEQMSQKREYIQQRKRTLLQNQQPSHLTAPTVPADYVAPSPAVAPAAPPTSAHSAVTTNPVSYGSGVYGGSAAVSSASHSLYDYSGQSGSYPVAPPPVASTAVTSAIPGYPPSFANAPPPFSAQYPPPPATGYGSGYGFPGMMMPPPDQTYGSTANAPVSTWNVSSASSVGGAPAYGQQAQQPGNAQSRSQTSVSWSASQAPAVMQNVQTPVSSNDNMPNASNSQFQDYSSAEFSGGGPRPRFPGAGSAPRGFGNQGDQRWPGPRHGQPGSFGQQNFEPRMGSIRQPGPGFDKEVDSFKDSSSNQNEGENWMHSGFDPNVPSSSSNFGPGIRPGAPGGFGPRSQGPRSDGPGVRPLMMRGPRPNLSAGIGPRPGMLRGPRPLTNQQFSSWQEDATGFDEGNAEDPESMNESYGEEMEQPGSTGMMGFGQQNQMFGQKEFQPRGIRPGMGGMPSGFRPGLTDSTGRGPRPLMGDASGRAVPRGIRPSFDGPGGAMLRPGWGGPRMRFPGQVQGEEHIIDDHQDEYNEESAFDNGQHMEDFGEENAEGDDQYGAGDDSVIESGFGNRGRGFPGNFGAPGMPGHRPPRPGFPQQQQFGAPRPRMDMRGPGAGFGGPSPNLRPRGPVPLMGIRVRPPSLSESSVADNSDPATQHGVKGFAENEEASQDAEEVEEQTEFGEDQFNEFAGGFGQTGIRPLGQHGLRPRMVGPRGFLGEQRPMEPGFRPRGPIRFAPRGSGPRGQPPGFDVRGPRPAFSDPTTGQQRGVRPLFGEQPSGQRPVRPGFGDSMFGRSPQGPFPRGPRMGGPPRFGGPGEYYGEYGFDEPADNEGEEEFCEQEEDWQQGTVGNNAGVVKSDDGKSAAGKPLKLSEHEHELIKKATEELMQKKLPSLDILSKFVSPSDKAGGGQRNEFDNDKQFREQHEPIGGPNERFEEGFGVGRGVGRGRDQEFGRGRERPGPFENRRGFPPGGLDEQLQQDQDVGIGFPHSRGRPFMPDRMLPPGDRMLPPGDRMLPPRDRPFPDDRRFGDRSNFPEGRQEFDPEFRGQPHPGADSDQRGGPGPNRGNRFGGGRGPEDNEMMFRGPPAGGEREFRGPREDAPFRGPFDDLRRGEFRGPPGAEFELERRILDERGPEWERGESRLDRGGRFPRPLGGLGGPRDLFEQEEFPPRPFGFGRGGPPSLMDLRRPGPSEPTTVIDYGHGQPETGLGIDDRRSRDDVRRREDDMRRERRPDEGFDREFGRPPPPDMRRQFREEGPPRRRSRSRSPPFPQRDHESRGQERGNFDRMVRGRDREPDRPAPPGPGGRLNDNDLMRSHHSEDAVRRQPERPGPEVRGFPAFSRGGPVRAPSFQPPPRPVVEEVRVETVTVDDLLVAPGRLTRPDHMVVIIRGPPGAGKTYVSKLLKDKEVANGGTAPRMLCLDDYFVVEVEKTVTEPETGRKVKKMVMEYEYDAAMEPAYRISFLKSFRRQIDDCFFNFIIVDAIFDKAVQLEEFWSYAKSKGFQVYIVDVQADIATCSKRNTHHRTQADIQKVIDGWDETPKHHIRLDIRSLLQEAAIEDVEMEDTTVGDNSNAKPLENSSKKEDEEEVEVGYVKSKWELDTSEQHLGHRHCLSSTGLV